MGTVVITFKVERRVGPLFAGLDALHYEASCNKFTPKLHALNQFQKFHYLLHVSTVGSLRPATMVHRDVVDVASNHWVTLFDIEPSGVPTFQGGIQRNVDVFAGHPIPEL